MASGGTRRIERERIWLRDLLARVAAHLESLAMRDRDLARVLLPVARRIRRRLHEGVPESWRPGGRPLPP